MVIDFFIRLILLGTSFLGDTRGGTFLRKDIQSNDAHTSIVDSTPGRVLYLTFDDGPNAGTPVVLNILDFWNAPASFFLIGVHSKIMTNATHTMGRLRKAKIHGLYNHSNTHANYNHYAQFYRDPANVLTDFNEADRVLKLTTKIARTPGNDIWQTDGFKRPYLKPLMPAAEMLHSHGYQLFGWDAEWKHYKLAASQSATHMKAEIDNLFNTNKNVLTNHCVLLMHDAVYLDSKDSSSLSEFIGLIANDKRYHFDILENHPFIAENRIHNFRIRFRDFFSLRIRRDKMGR